MPEPVSRTLRVFLCHASQDKPAVRGLYKRLTTEGWIDPWLDEEKLRPGHNWSAKIEEAVESADAVVVFLSNNSVTKEGVVQKEIRRALDKAEEKPEDVIFIIPLRLEDCPVPRRLKAYQYQDYFNNVDIAYKRLCASLEERAITMGIDTFELRKFFLKQAEEKARKEKEKHIRQELEEKIRLKEEDTIRKQAEEYVRKKLIREARKRVKAEQKARQENVNRTQTSAEEAIARAEAAAADARARADELARRLREGAQEATEDIGEQRKSVTDALHLSNIQANDWKWNCKKRLEEDLQQSENLLNQNPFDEIQRSIEIQKVHRIRTALERFDKGSWGICKNCKNLISKERLIALPYAELCINCQTKSEKMSYKERFG